VDQTLEVFEVRCAGEAEFLRAGSDPLAAQVVGRVVIPAVALGVVRLSGFRIGDRMEAEHVYIRLVALGLYAACRKKQILVQVKLKYQSDALRRAKEKFPRESGGRPRRMRQLTDWRVAENAVAIAVISCGSSHNICVGIVSPPMVRHRAGQHAGMIACRPSSKFVHIHGRPLRFATLSNGGCVYE